MISHIVNGVDPGCQVCGRAVNGGDFTQITIRYVHQWRIGSHLTIYLCDEHSTPDQVVKCFESLKGECR